ncbi:hypothetical protein BT96DRAFT_158185 [Gymnopus androsaceus JB14]|uniref:F-box domain-containing protein n=1 Tax=Gymnopus androsaceus JB14 TaxID=1447944 RepID=A0A6A4HDV2_9AGAR|nr:hypothetical protein BT96DRAFT_158185 [Gymnopus androsaceus JB14]
MLLPGYRSAVLRLSRRLELLKTEVQRVTALRDRSAAVIEIYRKILHPIRHVPPEVLLKIFSYCTDVVDAATPSDMNQDSLDTRLAPWCFGQVCKYWRSVVLGSPRLWSSLALNLSKQSGSKSLRGSGCTDKLMSIGHWKRSRLDSN